MNANIVCISCEEVIGCLIEDVKKYKLCDKCMLNKVKCVRKRNNYRYIKLYYTCKDCLEIFLKKNIKNFGGVDD